MHCRKALRCVMTQTFCAVKANWMTEGKDSSEGNKHCEKRWDFKCFDGSENPGFTMYRQAKGKPIPRRRKKLNSATT